PAGGTGGTVPPALGGGNQPAPPEDDAGDGRTPLPDGGRRAEGVDAVRRGLQPGAAGDAGGRAAARRAAISDQFRGRAALAVVPAARHTAADAGRQPGPTGSGRAALPEAAPQEVPIHDPTETRVTPTPFESMGSGITSWHSGAYPYIRRAFLTD